MKMNSLFRKAAIVMAIVAMGFNYSCKKDETLSGADSQSVVTESLTDSYFDDADDITINASGNIPSGRTLTDNRFCEGTTVTYGTGTIDIDFGSTGCPDPRGNIRKGKIHIAYSGDIGSIGFTIVETFDDYSINGVKLEGTRTIERVQTNSENLIDHEITLEGGKVTWLSDNSYATRTASFTREINVSDETVTLNGTASGVNRNGKNYEVTVTGLLFKKSCIESNKIYMAVAGTRVYTRPGNLVPLTIDYGTGDCDRTVTVSIATVSFNVTISK